MHKKSYVSVILFLFATLNNIAQTNYSSSLDVKESVVVQNDQLKVNLDINLDKLDLKSDHMLVLTPVIKSQDGRNTVDLPQMVITGNRKSKSLKRTLRLAPQNAFNQQPYIIEKRKNNSHQAIPYRASIPLKDWMKSGQLSLREDVVGCADCNLASNSQSLRSPLLKTPFEPQYKANLVIPQIEEVKARNESLELRLNYNVNSSDIDPALAGNTDQIRKLEDLYNKLSSNKDLTIVRVDIIGYASPEGSFESNMKLSQKRAEAAANMMINKFKIDRNIVHAQWKGEDWDGLKELLEKSDMSGKQQVLDIIRSTDIKDGREAKIMRLNGGNVYRELKKDYFPQLRRNTCSINFTVAQFDVEKAKNQLETNPKLLSLHEMYKIANTYDKNSKEYKKVWLTAAQTFPDSEVAVVNAAAIEINSGNLDKAAQLLEKAKDSPEASNNMGVIMAKKGMYEQAKSYFTNAAKIGIPEATENLAQLNKLLMDLQNK